jgi:nucleotide-binding universal stress UspA family protein
MSVITNETTTPMEEPYASGYGLSPGASVNSARTRVSVETPENDPPERLLGSPHLIGTGADVAGYQRILVGVDGTPRTLVAADRAVALALDSGAELHIVDVVAVPSPGASVTGAGAAALERHVVELRQTATAALATVEQRARAQGVRCETHLSEGDPAAMICRIAGDIGADVIVVGNRGVDAAGRYVLGSVPEAVLHAASCDVLIVRTT